MDCDDSKTELRQPRRAMCRADQDVSPCSCRLPWGASPWVAVRRGRTIPSTKSSSPRTTGIGRPAWRSCPPPGYTATASRFTDVRNCTYLDENSYVLNYEDRTYDLKDIQTLDFIICPFASSPSLAHTMMSFGFRNGQYLGVSVEARLEEGESFSAAGGAIRQFEIMYVVADERDLIQLRTAVRKSDVYVYRCRVTPEEVRAMFVDVLKRANTLRKHPEFYDTLDNNCTTNIIAHFNRVRPGAIPWQPGSLLTGYADWEAYRLGLLVDYGSFEETRRRRTSTTWRGGTRRICNFRR